MMIGKILFQKPVDVNRFYHYASQNLAWCGLETRACMLVVLRAKAWSSTPTGMQKMLRLLPTIGLDYCEIQLVPHAGSSISNQSNDPALHNGTIKAPT